MCISDCLGLTLFNVVLLFCIRVVGPYIDKATEYYSKSVQPYVESAMSKAQPYVDTAISKVQPYVEPYLPKAIKSA